MRHRLLLADDHEVVLEGLQRLLTRPEFEIVGAVHDGRALVEAAETLRPDLIVADISMPLLNGVEAAVQIRKEDKRVKIIFLSMHPEPIYAIQAMRAGASGYIPKHAAGRELLEAIREVLGGGTYITPSLREPVRRALESKRPDTAAAGGALTLRQREVLQLVVEGKSAKEIGSILNVSSKTVEFHKYRIMKTLGIRTVAELAAYAVKEGVVS